MLCTGVSAWALAHLFPAVAPGARAALADKLGGNAYRGLFSLVIIASLLAIIFGWKSALPAHVYVPPLAGSSVVGAIVPIAFVLLAAASVPCNIRRFVRHPQMTGVVVWAAAHLLANGDSRSVMLFGGLGLWAILEIVFINRRDGAWEKPPPSPLWRDAVAIAAGVGIAALAFVYHGTLSGVALVAAR